MLHPLGTAEGFGGVELFEPELLETFESELVEEDGRGAGGVEVADIGQTEEKGGQEDVGGAGGGWERPVLGLAG